MGLSPDELVAAIRGAHAVVIRSATTITREVIEAADELVVVGRAGIGLDNVDIEAATERGVMVVNAPLSNAVSAAEHTMALLLAQARNVPQAHRALVAGRWERSDWTGVELAGKTLGIVGLGRIGALVASRARAFDMKLVAYDPFISAERAETVGAELLELDELFGQSDFVTLHLAKTPETMGLINAELLSKAKPDLRIVNVARGGIIDEQALADAIREGQVGGAALDVFAAEPTTESPLFDLAPVVVTPHLGASTAEAQLKAGLTIAEQVELALAGDYVPFAVNVAAPEPAEIVRPYMPLCEQLGSLFGDIVGQMPDKIEIEFAGEIGGYENQLGSLAAVKGLLAKVGDEPVSYVNALDVAERNGLTISTTATAQSLTHTNTVTIRSGDFEIAGTLAGSTAQPRIISVEGHTLDFPPAPVMLLIRNDDRPGAIGVIATALGNAGVNINDMSVGQSPTGAALMVIVPDSDVPESVIAAIIDDAVVESVRVLRR